MKSSDQNISPMNIRATRLRISTQAYLELSFPSEKSCSKKSSLISSTTYDTQLPFTEGSCAAETPLTPPAANCQKGGCTGVERNILEVPGQGLGCSTRDSKLPFVLWGRYSLPRRRRHGIANRRTTLAQVEPGNGAAIVRPVRLNSGRRCCHSGRRLLEFRFPPAATRFAGTGFARLRGVRFHCAQSQAC
jgi:hypothetical protein